MAHNDKKFKAIKHVFSLLSSSPTLKELVGEKIYPLIAPHDTKGDFIALRREGYKREDTKMGVALQRSIFSVIIVSSDWERSLDIADEVYDLLDKDHPEFSLRIRMENYGEDYTDNKFIQVLQFYME